MSTSAGNETRGTADAAGEWPDLHQDKRLHLHCRAGGSVCAGAGSVLAGGPGNIGLRDTTAESGVGGTMAKPISQPRPPGQGERMTYEEFLAWADEDTRAEWVNGEVVPYETASLRQIEIKAF